MDSQIPFTWVNVALEELLVFILGGDWGKEEGFEDPEYEKVLCIRASELRNWESERGETAAVRKIKRTSLEKRELFEGDILVEISGGGPEQPVGRTVLIDKTVLSKNAATKKICTNFFRLARPTGEIDPRYLNHFLQHFYKSGRISDYQAGSNNLRNLKFNDYLQVGIPLPPLNEQKRIVTKIEKLFSELDSGIAALKTARDQLKVYRQAVLKHAFEGKLTAQWREENGVARDSWQVENVKDLALLGPSNGRSVKDRARGFPVLRLTALKNGKLDLNEFKEGDWDGEQAQNYIVHDGDFLFSRGNGSKHLVGRGGLVTNPQFEVAFPDTIMRIRLDKAKVNPCFFSYVWESRLIRNQIEGSARTTAGIYKINQQHVKSFVLSLPSLAEQEVIAGIIEEKLSIIDMQLIELEKQLVKAETLRQSILKKAFSGQLVPQDPSDEPASELLARIQAEKEAEIAKQGAKKVKRKPDRKSAISAKESV